MTSPIGPDARRETPPDGVVRGACPHDCPDTCAMLVTVEDGRADPRRRRSGPPIHARLSLREGESVRRAHLSHDRLRTPLRRVGPKGSGQLRADLVGRRARRDRRRGCTRSRESSDGPQAILPYSYAGTMGLLQGSSMDRRFFHAARRVAARPHDLLDGRHGRHANDGRREHRRRRGGNSAERSRAALGHEHADGESASLAVRARGARARRADHLHRSDPDAHRGAVRRVDRDPPRHRRARWRSA